MTVARTITADAVWPEQGSWTYDDWLRLPSDGTKFEVLGGVLSMTPAPSTNHQSASLHLTRAIVNFVEEHDLGEVFVLEGGEYALFGAWGDGDHATTRVLEGLDVDVSDVFRGARRRSQT